MALIFSALLLVASLFAAAPGLHNEHPFLFLWPFAAGWVALLIWRSIGRARHRGLSTQGSAAVAIILWLLSTAFAGLGLWQAIFGVDPHVLTAEMNTCRSNLGTLGSWLQEYAQTHQGKFPPTLNDLLEVMNDSDPRMFDEFTRRFICPCTRDTATTGPTKQAAIAALMVGGHCSYIYLGAKLKLNSPRGTVLMYEPFGHHPHLKNAAVLYTDGSVDLVGEAESKRRVAELEARNNPPNHLP